jgi:hypothetical protein
MCQVGTVLLNKEWIKEGKYTEEMQGKGKLKLYKDERLRKDKLK